MPTPPASDDLSSVEIRLLSLPTRSVLGSSHDGAPPEHRELVVVRVTTADGASGWGECSALNRPTYSSESAAGAFDVIAAWADDPTSLNPAIHPMAAAGIEMAILDAELKARNESLAAYLGATAGRVRAGATIGLLPVVESMAAAAGLVEEGYGRIKVKVGPDQVDAVPHEMSHAFSDLDVQVDANGSLDERHLMDLLSLGGHGVTAIEQPFARDRLDLAAEFASVSEIPIIADEAVRSLADAQKLHTAGALNGVSIKAARLGGLAAAMELLAWCRANGVAASAGGMLECGLGRHALAALAACEGFTITGDLSPARRWLAADPWPDLAMTDGWIGVPDGPGVAPEPDHDVLDEFTVRQLPENG